MDAKVIANAVLLCDLLDDSQEERHVWAKEGDIVEVLANLGDGQWMVRREDGRETIVDDFEIQLF